ncbi:MAG: ActS/PrrB/RegB family redox-sensitive histidine kinase [Rhizobiaceae bacterium]|nr:ActS/PrrB/RegB family redox-sensitive histidine kinase [Rhizobiaceae bacterium]MCV0404976.1 ActS/PrrB/RegB family redox-sensitive histidine kinase [Rhizobiaceae bacterium]
MTQDVFAPDPRIGGRLRLNTLIRLRWLAVFGQSAAVIAVGYGFDFPLPVSLCFALIACSAWLNLFLAFRYPATHRLEPLPAFGVLVFDALQLGGLLYMTGGLTNPFSVLMAVPVVICATSLPFRLTIALGLIVVGMATFLVFNHLPLPWYDGVELAIPTIYVAGIWMAVVSTMIFTAIYAWRVAEEARLLGMALSATELVLQREQHLSALDGLAAAAAHELGTPLATIALVSKEMEKALATDPRFSEDVTLLRSQSERCRDILTRLTSLSTASEEHLARMPFTSLIEEVIAPHRDFGIRIVLEPGPATGPEPVGRRNPGVIYGLGNIVENAVDFARERVVVRWSWTEDRVRLVIKDDGPGFPAEILDRIGEPYTTTRTPGNSEGGGGLGLGLFIAKTLLERSGAQLSFRNDSSSGNGAVVEVSWPLSRFRADEATFSDRTKLDMRPELHT